LTRRRVGGPMQGPRNVIPDDELEFIIEHTRKTA
jgi:hypothetical protein